MSSFFIRYFCKWHFSVALTTERLAVVRVFWSWSACKFVRELGTVLVSPSLPRLSVEVISSFMLCVTLECVGLFSGRRRSLFVASTLYVWSVRTFSLSSRDHRVMRSGSGLNGSGLLKSVKRKDARGSCTFVGLVGTFASPVWVEFQRIYPVSMPVAIWQICFREN